MIWENKVKLIIMLCCEYGANNREECAIYWKHIEEVGQTAYIYQGDDTQVFQVKLIAKRFPNERMIHRRFELKFVMGEGGNDESSEGYDHDRRPHGTEGSGNREEAPSMILDHI